MSDSVSPWQPGKCRVPMWSGMGMPDGHCGKPAFGHRLPKEMLRAAGFDAAGIPYCCGHACPAHGGPGENEMRVFMDGYTGEGRPMWCAVDPDFENLQESPAGFDGNPFKACAKLVLARNNA